MHRNGYVSQVDAALSMLRDMSESMAAQELKKKRQERAEVNACLHCTKTECTGDCFEEDE